MRTKIFTLVTTISVSLASLIWQSSAVENKTFTRIDTIFGAEKLGQMPGDDFGSADVSAIELPDGRVRIYYGIFDKELPGKVGSAISTDGQNFTAEPGLRITPIVSNGLIFGAASPFAYQLPDGKIRLFYDSGGGLKSSTSTDGLTFTEDTGMRLVDGAFVKEKFEQRQGTGFVCTAIMEFLPGNYRMYCSQKVIQSKINPIGDRAIFSATSKDLLNWTPETGQRIGPGTPYGFDADHPTIISNSENEVILAFDGYAPMPPSKIVLAKSKDGLNFTEFWFSGIYGTEAAYLKTKNGSEYLYYGNHSTEVGSTISLAKPGPINLTNQKVRTTLTCYALLGFIMDHPIIQVYDFNPVCPKDYTTQTPEEQAALAKANADAKAKADADAKAQADANAKAAAEQKARDIAAEEARVKAKIEAEAKAKAEAEAAEQKAKDIAAEEARVKAKIEAEAKAKAEAEAKAKAEAAAKAAAAKKTTITCVKGKTIKKVTAVNPKCPTGYKKK